MCSLTGMGGRDEPMRRPWGIPLRLAVVARRERVVRARADIAGAFTDVLRALAKAARDCNQRVAGPYRAIDKAACTSGRPGWTLQSSRPRRVRTVNHVRAEHVGMHPRSSAARRSTSPP